MDDYDRERSSRSNDPYGRSRSAREEQPVTGRPPRNQPIDDFDQPGSYPEPQRTPTRRVRGDDQYRSDPGSVLDPQERVSDTSERYSDRFRRSQRAKVDEGDLDSRSYGSTRDPYDRLRTTASKPAKRVEFDPIDDLDLDYLDENDDPRPSKSSRAGRSSNRRPSQRVDSQKFRTVGASLANPAPEIRPLAIGGIVAVASLVLLSVLVLVRSGSLPAWIPMHLDAEGVATEFGTTATIWRLPFFAFMSTVAALGLGWWLRAREAYATQYLIVGALLVHGLIWVGTINLLW